MSEQRAKQSVFRKLLTKIFALTPRHTKIFPGERETYKRIYFFYLFHNFYGSSWIAAAAAAPLPMQSRSQPSFAVAVAAPVFHAEANFLTKPTSRKFQFAPNRQEKREKPNERVFLSLSLLHPIILPLLLSSAADTKFGSLSWTNEWVFEGVVQKELIEWLIKPSKSQPPPQQQPLSIYQTENCECRRIRVTWRQTYTHTALPCLSLSRRLLHFPSPSRSKPAKRRCCRFIIANLFFLSSLVILRFALHFISFLLTKRRRWFFLPEHPLFLRFYHHAATTTSSANVCSSSFITYLQQPTKIVDGSCHCFIVRDEDFGGAITRPALQTRDFS